jgi:hypothetical protein
MYNRLNEKRSAITNEFYTGVYQFIEFAKSQDTVYSDGILRCPCAKCKCKWYKLEDDVLVHLFNKGFMPNYYRWTCHGEKPVTPPPMVAGTSYYAPEGLREEYDSYEQMVMDAAGPKIGIHLEDNHYVDDDEHVHVEEDRNPDTQ